MAKELPWFKFECSKWDNGNIQMCSSEAKGLFMDICSTYWTRLGELSYALALQKHCKGDTKPIKELIDSDVIVISSDKTDMIFIEFLDEQLNEFQDTSKKRSDAANKRWNKCKPNAKAMQVHSKSNAIREEKRREDNKKEEYIKKYPNSLKIVKHFISTLEDNNRYIPKTDAQKLEWLKVAQWSINQMGEHGVVKVIDIIDYFRSGSADNNNFSWSDNWLSLKKLQNKNKEGVTYLDFFWEKAKTKFEYKQ